MPTKQNMTEKLADSLFGYLFWRIIFKGHQVFVILSHYMLHWINVPPWIYSKNHANLLALLFNILYYRRVCSSCVFLCKNLHFDPLIWFWEGIRTDCINLQIHLPYLSNYWPYFMENHSEYLLVSPKQFSVVVVLVL